ncbi:hypothetical protein L2E82_25133 [Cichorium intybus]|uniref:Uncharacterized protein n=1 Tax=Cichorium intybus TaxID=13427 RepID=A0ACB9E373_CICIN|nr:hypothetical protein L2E82_25133 [Cichorium intybus]
MTTTPLFHHFIFFVIPLLISSISALNSDGTILLSFKNSLLSHSSSLFENWNHTDATPCSWSGVTCAPEYGPVISLVLRSSHILGSIPNDFGRLQYLRSLDLSDNSINGTLPISLFNCSELQTLSLSSNYISGELPELISGLQSLRVLNLSHNGFVGKLPKSLSSLKKLTEVRLNNNYFSGGVLGGFDYVEVLNLASNKFNGTLPFDFGGGRLNYLNLSNNLLSGPVYLKFAEMIPANAVVDLSFNKFTGQIPEMLSLYNQKEENFAGNLALCGKPLKKMCTVPTSHSIPTNVSSDGSATAAIAAIPKKTAGQSNNHGRLKVNPVKIAAIVVGDVAAMVLFAVLFFYAYQLRKTKTTQNPKEFKINKIEEHNQGPSTSCSCFHCTIREETSETATESEPDGDHDNSNNNLMNDEDKRKCLVMVDGETELDMETLLKASAYILGSSHGSIMYKAVVGGGGDVGEMAFAVRRIGESAVEKMREFVKIVRVIGKFRHRNLVKLRGFYWGDDEKLVIYDYVSNGSLAGAAYKNIGSSSCHLSFEARLKIAKGIAKGLSYIHEKKHVHGNIKPSNILLTSEMDPIISDFGLEWLISGKTSYTTRNFGSKRSTSSRDQETMFNNTYVTSLLGYTSPYHAPESMKTHKWDVYSFGIVLLELLSGKVFTGDELTQWNMESSTLDDNETKILKMIDGLAIADVYEKKESNLTCFKLGFCCASFAPQKRPSMREALQVLEKITCTS